MAAEPEDLVSRRWLPPAVLLASLAATAGLCAWSLHTNAGEARALLERHADSFGQALSNRVQSYIDTLPGLQTFGVLKHAVSDAEFSQYVRSISLQQRFPGLALTFVAELVPAAQRGAFVDQVRQDRSVDPAGHPGFDIAPPGERPLYMVLRHTYPFDAGGFGYDLFDPAQRYRAAVDQALASGSYVATGPLLLARDRFQTDRPDLTSIVIRGGVYAGGLTPATPAARRAAASGVVGVSFHSADIVRSVLPPELARNAVLRIVDRQAQAAGQPGLVFDSAWLGPAAADTGTPPLQLSLAVADRTWDVEVRARPLRWRADSTTWWLLGLGTALSLSLAVMTRTLVRANTVAERRIRQGTAALQAEKDNLEKSESRYRMLFANSMDAVLRTRPTGEVLAANAAACALFGRSEADMLAAGRERLVDSRDPRLAAFGAERERTGHARGMLRLLKADGSTFEAEVASSTYLDDEGRTVASVIVRDVTEPQRLAERQAMLSAILDGTPDFVGMTDPAGSNVYLNRAWRRLLGRGEDEDVSALKIADCHPAWAARIVLEEGVPAAVRDGAWFGRTAVQAADGREIPVLQLILCHRNTLGDVTQLSTIARDLTELERVQADRRALESQLQEAQKLESIGTLAGGVAHDFNNVLAAILGNAVLARQDAAAGRPVLAGLDRIEQAARRARTLVQQILTFSRRTPQVHRVQPLQPPLHEALALLRATLPATALLVPEIADTPLPVRIDAAQVQQVVMNLCTNAWQALPDQQGRIDVRLAAVELQADDARPPGLAPGRYARLQVQDNGAGMDEATRSRIFEPFFTTKPVGHGTGLGLAVVHGIVTACGGAISVTSLPGQGTRFDVYLPLQTAVPETAAPAVLPAGPAPAGSGQHVLCVDDDPVVGLTLQLQLEHLGYRVTRIDDAQAALAAVRAAPQAFDLVITDHNMPGLSGLGLAQALRELAPALPVIITSGYVTDALRQRALDAGVRAVLLKEYATDRLADLVHEVLAAV
jgi:PAS domain S-box-containing protein